MMCYSLTGYIMFNLWKLKFYGSQGPDMSVLLKHVLFLSLFFSHWIFVEGLESQWSLWAGEMSLVSIFWVTWRKLMKARKAPDFAGGGGEGRVYKNKELRVSFKKEKPRELLKIEYWLLLIILLFTQWIKVAHVMNFKLLYKD